LIGDVVIVKVAVVEPGCITSEDVTLAMLTGTLRAVFTTIL
jgi:hypothetical protein